VRYWFSKWPWIEFLGGLPGWKQTGSTSLPRICVIMIAPFRHQSLPGDLRHMSPICFSLEMACSLSTVTVSIARHRKAPYKRCNGCFRQPSIFSMLRACLKGRWCNADNSTATR
jgi:hypothetical protein